MGLIVELQERGVDHHIYNQTIATSRRKSMATRPNVNAAQGVSRIATAGIGRCIAASIPKLAHAAPGMHVYRVSIRITIILRGWERRALLHAHPY